MRFYGEAWMSETENPWRVAKSKEMMTSPSMRWLEDADESARFARSSHRIQVLEIEVIVRISGYQLSPSIPSVFVHLAFWRPLVVVWVLICFVFVFWFYDFSVTVCSLIILKLPTVTSVHCVLEMLRRAWAQDSTRSDTKWNTRCATRWRACSDFSAIYQWLSGQLGRNCQRSRGHQMQSPEIAIWKAQELNSSFIYESMISIYIYNYNIYNIYNYIHTYIHGRICMCLFVP